MATNREGTISRSRFRREPEFEMGGSGLYGTVGDYMRFVRMVLNGGQLGGERVLTPETVVSLGLNHMGDCRVYKLKAAIPLPNDAEFFPGINKPGLPGQPRSRTHRPSRRRPDVGRGSGAGFGQPGAVGPQSGMTAVTSISTLARSSINAATCTAVIATAKLPISSR